MIRIHSRAVPRDPEDRLFSRSRLLGPDRRNCAGDASTSSTSRRRSSRTTPGSNWRGGSACRWSRATTPTSNTTCTTTCRRCRRGCCSRWRGASRCRSATRSTQWSRRRDRWPRRCAPTACTRRSRCCRQGCRPERFTLGDGARFRARTASPARRPVALFLGRVAHEKNIDFLIRMLVALRARVPGRAAGASRARVRPRRIAAPASPRWASATNVMFVGYLDRRGGLADCYRAADVFVFASRTETQGLVLLEAMAQGTPVVSTAVMGTVDVLAGAERCGGGAGGRDGVRRGGGGRAADPARRAELGERARAGRAPLVVAARWPRDSCRSTPGCWRGAPARVVDGSHAAPEPRRMSAPANLFLRVDLAERRLCLAATAVARRACIAADVPDREPAGRRRRLVPGDGRDAAAARRAGLLVAAQMWPDRHRRGSRCTSR